MTPAQIVFGVIIIGAALAILAMFWRAHREEQRRRHEPRIGFAAPPRSQSVTDVIQTDTISLEEWRRRGGVSGPIEEER